MGLFKVLGTAVAGVGVAALFPVAGPVAAVAMAGFVVSRARNEHRQNEDRREAYAAARADAEAAHAKKYSDIREKLEEQEELEKTILAMFALGIAVANLDGEITDEERLEIEEFVAGAVAAKLPESLQDSIRQMYVSPPTITQALGYISKAGLGKEEVEDLIELVIHADGVATPEEESFRAKWAKFRGAVA